jgi:hypothetical protein
VNRFAGEYFKTSGSDHTTDRKRVAADAPNPRVRAPYQLSGDCPEMAADHPPRVSPFAPKNGVPAMERNDTSLTQDHRKPLIIIRSLLRSSICEYRSVLPSGEIAKPSLTVPLNGSRVAAFPLRKSRN